MKTGAQIFLSKLGGGLGGNIDRLRDQEKEEGTIVA